MSRQTLPSAICLTILCHQQVWLLCAFLPVTTSAVWLRLYRIALPISHYQAFLAIYGLREASLQFALIDNNLCGCFHCFYHRWGVWWTGECGVCLAESEWRSRIQGWILDPKRVQHLSMDPKRTQHLSLSTTGINQDRWQIVLLSFFWQCFPHIENTRLICNAIICLVFI